VLYIAMGKGADGGRGSLDLRSKRRTSTLDSIKYFSKGTEVPRPGAIREGTRSRKAHRVHRHRLGPPVQCAKLPWRRTSTTSSNAVASNVTTRHRRRHRAPTAKRRLVPFSELTDFDEELHRRRREGGDAESVARVRRGTVVNELRSLFTPPFAPKSASRFELERIGFVW
jgi:hypothetical protein